MQVLPDYSARGGGITVALFAEEIIGLPEQSWRRVKLTHYLSGVLHEMPSISGFGHLSLSVTDLARSVDWYTRVLGFVQDGGVSREGFERARLVDRESQTIVALTQHHATPPEDAFSELRTGMDHVAFIVPSLEELEACKRRFEELGVEHSEIKAVGAGSLITFRDPDNIQLEVHFRG